MRRNSVAVFLLICLLAVASDSVFAQGTVTVTPTITNSTSLSPTKGANRFGQNALEKRKEQQALREQKIQEFQDRLEKRREQMEDRIASKEAQLKSRLDKFKNRAKAQVAERVSANLNKINELRTKMMQHNLTQMEMILGKVKDRTDAATAEGKNTSSILTAITSAQTAIDAAKPALTTQAGKDYTLSATDETAIRAEAQAKREQLHKDLIAVHELVKTARKAVSNAIRTAYSTLGKGQVDGGDVSGTPSVTVTPGSSVTVTATPTAATTLTPTNTGTPTSTVTPTP